MDTATRRHDRTSAFRAAEAKVLSADSIQRALDRLHAAGVTLPPKLAEAARLRMAHPGAPLSSLAASASGPCTKDALAGRLRRVIAAAAKVPEPASTAGSSRADTAGESLLPAASTGHVTWDPWDRLEQINRRGPAIVGTPSCGTSRLAVR